MNLAEPNHIEELLQHNEECDEETSPDHLLSLGSPDIDDIYGDAPILPRLGDQYQAEVPPLLTESERLQLCHSWVNSDDVLGANYSIGVGLAISIIWVHHVGDHIKFEQQEFLGASTGADTAVLLDSTNNKEGLIVPNCCLLMEYLPVSSSIHYTLPQMATCRDEFRNEPLEHDLEVAVATSQECSDIYDHKLMELSSLQLKKQEGNIPLPGSPVVSWSDVEQQSFLLGLYIFGRNLVQVKKFMGSKEMGDILSFYYGKFYRSEAHCRWSYSRKIRSRKCIQGQRLFTGWRQQELLSRVLPCVPKEVHGNLLEAAKSFSEGRSSLEELVFTLKGIVGIELLIEAIGIDKGKHDLTGTVLDPARSNHDVPIRREIPVGKEYSSLTSGDIIKFLTGGFRLSKAKSNDLFWEAVWPRLLARGWHSEQPRLLSSACSRNALVFLIPGIKKFSRSKLTKGNHYFDSVSDVLNKVASNPRLLELEVEGARGSSIYKDECRWDVDTESDQNGPPDQQHHCYIYPRLPNCNSELTKFTVVDTSLVQDEGPFKVREPQGLPADAIRSYRSSNCSGEMDNNTSKELADSYVSSPNDQVKSTSGMSDGNKFWNIKKCMVGKGMQYDPSDYLVSVSKRRLGINGHDSKDPCYEVLNDKQLINGLKYLHRVKSGEPNHLGPMSKRQKLTACKSAGTGRRSCVFSRDHWLKKDAHHKQKSVEVNELTGVEVGPSRGKSTSSSAKHCIDESGKCNSHPNFFCAGAVSKVILSQEKTLPSTLIDLNIPHFPPDFDAGEPFSMEKADGLDGLNLKGPSFSSEAKQESDGSQVIIASNVVPSIDQPTTDVRRQSTRNRPPTTKALEALACGFLSTRRKGRGTKAPPSNDLASRPSC